MNEEPKRKSTLRGNTELINLRVPLSILPVLNEYAASMGVSRSRFMLIASMSLVSTIQTLENYPPNALNVQEYLAKVGIEGALLNLRSL